MISALVALAVLAAADVRAKNHQDGNILVALEQPKSAGARQEPAAVAGDGKIQHTPLQKTARGENVVINAKIQDPSHLFAPLVFARKAGTERYDAYTMRDGGRRGFQARLPSSILSEGTFEYFIESQHEEGVATRAGSPRQPFSCVAFDPPLQPVAYTLRTREPGAEVKVDGNDAGRTPTTVSLLPGPHTVTVTTADGRSAEQQLEVKGRRAELDLVLELPKDASAPGILTVRSDPTDANVLIDGVFSGRTPFRGELREGEHLVAVEMEGRLREERKVLARNGRDAQLLIGLAPVARGAALSVDSDPPGATVLIDGKPQGRTPFVSPVVAGRHQLLLQQEGRRDVSTDFEMPKDRDFSIRLALPPTAHGASRLTITSAPAGATLTLDGTEVGVTPWSGETKPGSHRVSVVASGFVKEDRAVQVLVNRDTELAFALGRAPGPARLHVETEPPGASVRIDSAEGRQAPFTAEVQPGEHQLEVSLAGHRTVAQQVTLDAGQGLSLRFALQAVRAQEPPLIAVSSDPAGARIYLDGNLVGTTPVKLRATPGQHEVKLALDGYVPRVTRPNIPADRDFEMRVTAILKPVRGVEQKQHAPTVDELYQAQVQSAHAAYVKGDLEGALSGYRSAYQYKPDPRVLFNIAQMRRKLGRFEEAATTYRDFIGQADKKKKGATQKELLAEAKRQLAACEAKLVPSLAEAPVPEDTTPPRLQHEPVRSALRGHSLRVLADVTDDRSGVGSVEACWRNAFGRDFECHAMGNVSGDRYGIEVPARVVTDGFAYYLQAYDNADNGPARSGAPELPYAVLIEEPAAPQVTAAVEAALAGKVAAAPQATVADFKPSAGAPPPAADRIASPANLTTGGARPGPWTLTARLGGARSTESSYTDSALVGRAGIEASRWFGDWFTAMSFDFRSYHQQYVPANSTTGERVQVDESRYDLGLSGGYDLGPRIVESGKLELTPFAAFQYVTVRNTGFPFEVVGPGGGLRAGWTIAPFTLRAAFGYTYNLAKDSTGSSTFKAPTSTFSGLAGLEARLTPNWAVELDYLFDGIQFDQVTRVAHGGALGFSTSF